MSRPNWRDPADYEALRSADVATLAGEFLRRNPDYQADRERLVRVAAGRQLTQAERDTFALAWGVRFRGGRRPPGLDAAGAPQRRRFSHDAAGAGRVISPS
jgi:hypothetical protein